MNRAMKKRPQVIEEPCTLIYKLYDCIKLPFKDFYLIVRSLHSYMVESITPYPDTGTVHVKLQYQASIANATKKMGEKLAQIVSITKLSSFINSDEISQLDDLKRRFGFGDSNYDSAPEASFAGPHYSKKRKYREMPALIEEDGEQEL